MQAYQGVDVIDGVPVRSGWKVGEMVQRAHEIRTDELGKLLPSILFIGGGGSMAMVEVIVVVTVVTNFQASEQTYH